MLVVTIVKSISVHYCFFFVLFVGVHFPPPEVQHGVSDEDCCGASEPLRTPQDVGWSAQGQQELSSPDHQGQYVLLILSFFLFSKGRLCIL